MTVSTTLNKVIYQGNGSSTVFAFSFPGVVASDIQVYFTDASGNVTLLASSAYTLSLTAATGTNPTGAGGSVTYNPSGTPIATGTTLTILRTLPFSQLTSFANQGNLWQPVVEQAFDYSMMAIQQVEQQVGQQLTVPVSDPVPGTIPAVAQRASKFLAFDASGNPIASNTGATTTPVSSAMAPVVAAATLAAGRTAFGLGNVSVEAIGLGLADSSGSLQVQAATVSDSTGQSVTSAFHTSIHFATIAITYTLPRANTLFNGFMFTVSALTDTVTFTINAADKFSGGATGTSMLIPAGTSVTLVTDAAGAGTWFLVNQQQIGLESPLNLQITASVAGNNLTIAIKDRNGNDPSTASPILLAFRSPSVAVGSLNIRVITSALSVVLTSGNGIGSTDGNTSRVWLVCFDNGGTPVLGAIICSTATQIFPLDETADQTAALVGASNNAGTIYTTGSAPATKPIRILGFVESTQATHGTWASSPSKIQLFGPGIKKPGDTVQENSGISTTGGQSNSATYIALTGGSITVAITPTSAANLIFAEASAGANQTVAATTTLRMSRGTVAATNLFGCEVVLNNTNALVCGTTLIGYDLPNTTGATTYAIQGKTSAGTLTYPSAGTNIVMRVKEIMG